MVDDVPTGAVVVNLVAKSSAHQARGTQLDGDADGGWWDEKPREQRNPI